ncbi:MAG: ornithine cyclodeaminase family protein [Devosia nanyangense]|uniref:Ornithine cyclodeaminase family protein n=1 Tax=Devosia nanyangense TaxID=1228055 RepID=A0A933L462_9HYPH|nr:ornithine cyclodeaminase family protein [Devosia nanyangense]
MLVISEQLATRLVSIEDAIAAVETAFAGMARGTAKNYPVVREVVGYQDAVFGVKTGADIAAPLLGLKAGGYWPHNLARGLTNHQSATLLFDADTGRAAALVSANYLTGVRTGAASAIASKYLAREDASVLGIIGTGAQSVHQLRATMAVRPIRRVHAWDPAPANLQSFGEIVRGLGLEFVGEPYVAGVAGNADILITVTPSQKALVEKSSVRPGTHISAMGADTKGKQELDPHLVAGSAIFVDEAAQSLSIGECQHAFAAGLIAGTDIRSTLGAVVAGLAAGRRDASEITLFDGTGVALQDLVVAALAVKRAVEQGLGTQAEY